MRSPITGLALDIERQAVGALHGREPRHGVLATLVAPGHSLVFSTTTHDNSDILLMYTNNFNSVTQLFIAIFSTRYVLPRTHDFNVQSCDSLHALT